VHARPRGILSLKKMTLSHDAQRNRDAWDRFSDEYQAAHASQLNDYACVWGLWNIPEAELHVLGDVAGKDILEFGCGAAQWSIGLARRGARTVGLDNSARQLEHARRLMAAANVEFPLVHASAESVPLPDASFDIVFCDHGAMTFADPYKTVPEAARLLRGGGLLAFNMTSAAGRAAEEADLRGIRSRLEPIGAAADLDQVRCACWSRRIRALSSQPPNSSVRTSICIASGLTTTERLRFSSRTANGFACFAPTGWWSRI
jgi:SAM-dependent methyltransferase